MPRINLLPWRDQQRRERKLAFFVALGGAVVLGGIATFIAYLLVGSMIDGQDHRNERLRAQIKIVDKQIEEINDLEAQKQKFISRMQIIDKLQRSRPEVVHLFDEMVKEMPDGTYLSTVKQTGTKIKFEGVAQSSTRVSQLMRNISGSQWLRNPELEVVQTTNDVAGSSFVLDAEEVGLPDTDDNSAAKKPVRTAAGGTQ
ncbi:MAG TPA: PilN domain-containing protein [Steroidobacteraceae bacterium]|jgi:type IV pilus assembly protein PilN